MAQERARLFEVQAPPHELRPHVPFFLDVLRRLVREKPLGLFGGALVLLIAILAVTAPWAAPHGPNELGVGGRLEAPGAGHLFGTDNLGRDVFSRIIWGARIAMFVGFSAVTVATLISVTLGLVSGYFGGWFDILVQRLVDAFIAFPALVFLLGVIAVFRDWQAPFLQREGVFSTPVFIIIVSLGILFGVGQSRIIRGAVMSVSQATYVEAARAMGAGHARIILRHILPNVMAPVITLATLGLGNAILAEATLSFLGLGVPPDVPSWGGMLSREARIHMTVGWWLAVFPGVALSAAVFGFNMLGDALRDLLDPRLRTG